MNKYIILTLFAIALFVVGCKPKTVVVLPLNTPQSAFQILDGDTDAAKQRIVKKFRECEDPTHERTVDNGQSLLTITSSTFGLLNFYVKGNSIEVFPPFDSTQTYQAKLFKMAVHEEVGCPR
ncbi:hypothetical protein [Phascolarctobacterium faecium]|uniref:hypothetical protein n=1 Tax=Phascolarctobacterium faecium TaxID=33025 RepID=UPI003AF120B2